MELQDYVEDIKLELTGGITHLEIPDEIIAKLVNKTLREVQRYCDETRLITIPYAKCIDMTDTEVSSVSAVYRTYGIGNESSSSSSTISGYDPVSTQMWSTLTASGNFYNLNNYLTNLITYNTIQQIENTTSTDLAFKYDHQSKRLYINVTDIPTEVTIEYVPTFKDVSDIKTDYWQNILLRLSVAYVKVALGRIRSKYKQTNSLWEIDGDALLAEGNEELKELRETLRVNSQLSYPID